MGKISLTASKVRYACAKVGNPSSNASSMVAPRQFTFVKITHYDISSGISAELGTSDLDLTVASALGTKLQPVATVPHLGLKIETRDQLNAASFQIWMSTRAVEGASGLEFSEARLPDELKGYLPAAMCFCCWTEKTEAFMRQFTSRLAQTSEVPAIHAQIPEMPVPWICSLETPLSRLLTSQQRLDLRRAIRAVGTHYAQKFA